MDDMKSIGQQQQPPIQEIGCFIYWWIATEFTDPDVARLVLSTWYATHAPDRVRIELMRCVVTLLRGRVTGPYMELGPPFRGLALSIMYPRGWNDVKMEIVRREAPPDTYTIDFSEKRNRVVVMDQLREYLAQSLLCGSVFTVGPVQEYLKDHLYIYPCTRIASPTVISQYKDTS